MTSPHSVNRPGTRRRHFPRQLCCSCWPVAACKRRWRVDGARDCRSRDSRAHCQQRDCVRCLRVPNHECWQRCCYWARRCCKGLGIENCKQHVGLTNDAWELGKVEEDVFFKKNMKVKCPKPCKPSAVDIEVGPTHLPVRPS